MFFHFTPENYTEIVDIYGPATTDVRFLTYDSRNVQRHTAFFCIKGENLDGHRFIEQAAANGAVVIIGTDQDVLYQSSLEHPDITYIVVYDSQKMMSFLSAEFYDHVYKRMQTIAVTGTNGKTTVTSFIHYLLNRCGIRTGSVGTEKVWDDRGPRNLHHTTHTTPEAPDLHYILNTFFQEGLQSAVLEVTSIAIDQKRVDGLHFDIGVHTNLTPEHLDFHSSFEQYKQSKLTMFQQLNKAVVNLDDTGMSEDILQSFKGEILTYSLKQDADVSARILNTDLNGTELEIFVSDRTFTVRLPIFGEHNVSNFLAALSACLLYNVPIEQIIQQAPGLQMPNGRLNLIDTNTNFTVISDFAHTPDALVSVIEAARSLKPRRLILVIAGNGTRDPVQLPMLAEYAEGKADQIVVTTEHPDRKNRDDILADVLRGFQKPNDETISTALHREQAIKQALTSAEAGDIVLLTGLGPLDHQIIYGKEVPYSEIDAIHRSLKKLQTDHSHVK